MISHHLGHVNLLEGHRDAEIPTVRYCKYTDRGYQKLASFSENIQGGCLFFYSSVTHLIGEKWCGGSYKNKTC
jgi:hypothetical protein